ncbi:MAG: excinuclease ABC subunit UvrC [Oscillospiraceae bacterium]|nr:excinuclease ABC subunit UvrC [Oscillospiraceae bacterium]
MQYTQQAENTIADLRQKATALPTAPGVYLMKDADGCVIYIGKAKSLKNRVSQYFIGLDRQLPKVRAMVGHIRDFDYIVVGSEFEALVLECSLIKQNAPKYNILLKDDKGYKWIKVTKGDWPRLSFALQKRNDEADYYGPYTQYYSVKQAVEEALSAFMLPTCNRTFYESSEAGTAASAAKTRPCLQYYIKQCTAPCAGKVTKADYQKTVRDAVRFLLKGANSGLSDLRRQMEKAADNLDFETAAKLRDRIKSIENAREKQSVMSLGIAEADVFAVCTDGKLTCCALLRFADSRLAEKKHWFLEGSSVLEEEEGSVPTDTASALAALRSEILTAYYNDAEELPAPRIILDGATDDKAVLEEWLSAKRGKKVLITTPQKGEAARLVELAKTNALEQLSRKAGRGRKETKALEELQTLLGLPTPPLYIEAYDISHTGGADNVAGMVVFEDGKPLKSAYRKFAVKSFVGQDDYASLSEVISRRVKEYDSKSAAGETQGFARLPDLILLDGGKGQVHAVLKMLQCSEDRSNAPSSFHDVPVFGMVKDSKHRTRAIAADGGELSLSPMKAAFSLVTQMQDEVHRFAIAYHRKRHEKNTFTSALESIPGIGPKRAAALLHFFRTLEAIQSADESTLAACEGMNAAAAKAVYTALHNTDKQ